jgi:hypothetical protein
MKDDTVITLYPPFVVTDELTDELKHVKIGYNIRHDHVLHVDVRARRVYLYAPTWKKISLVWRAILTILVLVATMTVVYGWTSSERRRRKDLFLGLPWLLTPPACALLFEPRGFLGGYWRLSSYIVMVARWSIDMWYHNGAHFLSPAFPALEAVWTMSVLLSNGKDNIGSVAVSATLFSMVVFDMWAVVRSDNPTRTNESWPALEVGLRLVTLIVVWGCFQAENLRPLVAAEWAPLYGLEVDYVVGFLLCITAEVGFHISDIVFQVKDGKCSS